MINLTNVTVVDIQNFQKTRSFLIYFSILLFAGLIYIVSSALQKYMLSTTDNYYQIGDSQEENRLLRETIFVAKGDNLATILAKQNITKNEISEIIKAADAKALSSSLRIGQKIIFDYEIAINDDLEGDLATETPYLTQIIFELDKINSIKIERINDVFLAKNETVKLEKFLTKASVTIDSSFITGLKSLGLSGSVIADLVNAYSYEVDFQRQIKSGDLITIIGEKFFNEKGEFSHYGKILHASLNLSGKEYNIYNYHHEDKDSFFSEDGKSARRNLLRTPLNVIRVSSHYGKRMHPILGFTKMHHGVDFAAPKGTPIYAAGGGIITKMQWISGYGRAVQVKHDGSISTFYAHASSFAKNLRVGSKVKQGQVIAYVGDSGTATAAHLHYEVKINGKSVNPNSIQTRPNKELRGKELVAFKKFKEQVKNLSTALNSNKKSNKNLFIN